MLRRADPELDAVQEELFGTRRDGSAPFPPRGAWLLMAALPTLAALSLGIVVGTGRSLLNRVAC